jgi:hypothetical protein
MDDMARSPPALPAIIPPPSAWRYRPPRHQRATLPLDLISGSYGLPLRSVTSRKLVSQLSAVDAPYATWSSFPVVAVGLMVSSAMEASLR